MTDTVTASPDEIDLWDDIIPKAIKVPFLVYKHRHLLHKWLTHIAKASGLGKTDIVVTGRSAVGKTVLSCRMLGMAEDLAWDLPEPSRDVETSVITVGEWARIVRVIPGQTSQERDLGIHEAFSKHDTLQGVIHVVDWGFTPERDATIRQKRIEEDGYDTLDKWREFNQELERNEFEQLCERIRESHSRCGRPKWLVIAANKADLYMDDLNSAQRYYHPKTDSPFTHFLQQLQTRIGADHLKCAAVPVSSWDKDFEWNGKVVKSNVGGTTESRALFRNFVQVVSTLATETDNAG